MRYQIGIAFDYKELQKQDSSPLKYQTEILKDVFTELMDMGANPTIYCWDDTRRKGPQITSEEDLPNNKSNLGKYLFNAQFSGNAPFIVCAIRIGSDIAPEDIAKVLNPHIRDIADGHFKIKDVQAARVSRIGWMLYTSTATNLNDLKDYYECESGYEIGLQYKNLYCKTEDNNAGGLVRSSIYSTSNANPPSINPKHKVILNQVSGEAKQNEVLALMGPSGSGKTLLLDILSTRDSLYNNGGLYLNQTDIQTSSLIQKKFKRQIAYIKQKDIFFDHLTMKDQLTYTAFLRLSDEEYTKEEKLAEVDKVLSLLRLQKCANTQIRLVSG